MAGVAELASVTGTRAACTALGVSRATFYRRRRPPRTRNGRHGPRSPRALTDPERDAILAVMHEPRFVDKAPAEIYATLLDEGTYLCSVRTMYRLLAERDEVRERRNVLRHPAYAKPELLATQANEVWSWDITKLPGPAKWQYFRLYVVLDIFSRYVPGWLVAERESAELARRLLDETCAKQGIRPGQLTIHADHGAAMIAKPVAQMLADLGVTKSHSRPHVSDDNPFSEAQFKTLKYRPAFPDRFGSLADAQAFCRAFFAWYNDEHRHSGIGMLTPAVVHYGQADTVVQARHQVLLAAYDTHPERFVRGVPQRQPAPSAVWINPPRPTPPSEPGGDAIH